jgi:mutator protein MutT
MKHEIAAAFLLIREDRFLAERRRKDKDSYPGMMAIPGGRLESGESVDEALVREMREELDVVPVEFEFYCTLVEITTQRHLTIHYHVIREWEGEPVPLEAEELIWFPLKEIESVEVAIDRSALREYLRTFEDH